MPLDAHEQYLLELINRARLDPVAEMVRYNSAVASGVYSGSVLSDLNAGLAPGTITVGPAQPLAGNENLNNAAIAHSLHMLAVDLFEHEGIGDGDIGSRANSAGYTFTFLGENISWSGTTGSVDVLRSIENHQFSLFRSNGHRSNLHNSTFSEIGLGRELGQFFSSGTNFNASMLTEMFGDRNPQFYVTGVIYNDSNGNHFYTPGEGTSAAISVLSGGSTNSAASGGYSISVSNGTKQVTLGTATVSVVFAGENIKLDLMNGNHVQSSGSVTAVSGVATLELLGVGDLSAYGNSNSETLIGNAGNNNLSGDGGNDSLSSAIGNDTLSGGAGNDTLDGGAGSDTVSFADRTLGVALNPFINTAVIGGAEFDTILNFENFTGSGGNDILQGTFGVNVISGFNGDDLIYAFDGADIIDGGAGADVIAGGADADTITGGDGGDWLYGENGNDLVSGTAKSGGAFDVMIGGLGNDTLEGSAGGFDYFYGGAGVNGATGDGSDSYIVRAGTGIKVMNDFEAGGAVDVVRLLGTGFSSFAEVQAAMSFSGVINGTVLVVDAQTQIWFLNGTQPANLTAADFLYF